jgi:hypothetical protein
MTPFRVVRRRARELLAFGVVIAVLSISYAAWVSYDEAPPPTHLSARCMPFHRPTTVAGINAMIARYRRVPGFVGADVGADVRLQGGRSLWVFGDTLRRPDFHGQQFVRNSMLMFSAGCAAVVMPKDKGAVIPDRADGVGYWPMSLGVVHHRGYDMVGVGVQRVRATGAGTFDFEVLGPGIALFQVPVGKAPQLVAVRDLGPDNPSKQRPMWGAAVATVGNELYIYGTSNPGGHKAFGYALHVARTRIDHVLDSRTWRFWDGHRWQRKASRAAAVIPAVGGVSQVLSVFERDGSWYAVSKRDEFLGRDLVIWKAPSPTGPFVPSAPLAEIPSNSADGLLRYMPLAHPDLLPGSDRLVVSYSRNVADLRRLLKHPDLYRPHFLVVPLP